MLCIGWCWWCVLLVRSVFEGMVLVSEKHVFEPRPIELMERLARLKQRLVVMVDRDMHHNRAALIDLDGLEVVVDAVGRLLSGDRVEMLTAQGVAAAVARGEGVEVRPGVVTLVRKQKPPVAKPGRGRGFRARPDDGDVDE